MGNSDLVSILLGSSPVVISIFIVLILLSIATWGTIVAKYLILRQDDKADTQFFSYFEKLPSLNDIYKTIKQGGVVNIIEVRGAAAIFLKSFQELLRIERQFPDLDFRKRESNMIKSNIDQLVNRTLQNARNQEEERRDSYIGLLATTSSAAPFIGLLGTVIGIVNAFHQIGKMGSADLAFVAPAISEALVATALGLFVAIPSSVAFNYFKSRNHLFNEKYFRFCLTLQNRIQERYLFINEEVPHG